ncbi:KRAB-A domain-containing protein 2 [Ditylenchus destructor]|uniref:KRAB-A domain-containing protein 2 n=1 Tax=Ditylenchus destructor TaxID=166010 RepID=A0AAD4N5S8_9BILA|nr:KRAB-A domain-containing protein 2 [Ditylenchus destructor]
MGETDTETDEISQLKIEILDIFHKLDDCDATYDSILAAFAKRRNGEKLDKNSEQNFVSRYRLVESNGVEKLYRGHQEVVKQEEVFKILHNVHCSKLVHPGRDIMCKELKKYFGLTLFVSLCEVCESKKAKAKKGLVVKPIRSNNFNDRCQVDLIDLQARPDGEFKFLMVYQSDEYVPIDGSNWIALAETDEPLHKSNSASPSQSRSPSSERSQSPSALNNTIARLQQFPQRDRQILFEVENEEPSFSDAINEENQLNQLHFQREAEREGARAQQKRQAQQMLDGSAKRFPPIPVGQTVRVPVPTVDRAKTDPRNLLGVVMAVDDGFYSIGTGVGILKEKYTRNQIEPSSSQHILMESVPDKEISMRAAVGADSLSGTQGHVHCSCLRGCTTGKCKCKSLERLCNSRCHNSTTCKNK